MQKSKLFLAALFAAASLTTMAQSSTESPDTIKIFDKARRVTITRTDTGSHISVVGTSENDTYDIIIGKSDSTAVISPTWEPNFPFMQAKSKQESLVVHIGRNIYGGVTLASGGDESISTGFELGIEQLVGISYHPTRQGFSINTGLGYGYRRLSVKSTHMLHQGKDRVLALVPAQEGYSDCKSRIEAFMIHVPVTMTQRIHKNFAVTAGAMVNFNTYTVANSSYRLNDVEYNLKYKGLHQRHMTVDVIAGIGFLNSVGAYFRYSPMNMFDDGFGPITKSISAGISLNF